MKQPHLWPEGEPATEARRPRDALRHALLRQSVIGEDLVDERVARLQVGVFRLVRLVPVVARPARRSVDAGAHLPPVRGDQIVQRCLELLSVQMLLLSLPPPRACAASRSYLSLPYTVVNDFG